MRSLNKLKIGVIGSYKDKYYTETLDQIAFEVGKLVAKNGCLLIIGPEPSKELNSGVTAAAAKGAKSEKGTVIGILPGFYKGYAPQNVDIAIYSGGEIGGIREVVLTSSCDAIISIFGGAGTLTELALAYHNRIPVVTIKTTGGVSEQFAGKYLDYRKELHNPIVGVKTAKEAVKKAIALAKKFRNN